MKTRRNTKKLRPSRRMKSKRVDRKNYVNTRRRSNRRFFGGIQYGDDSHADSDVQANPVVKQFSPCMNLNLYYDDMTKATSTTSEGDYYNFFDKIKRGLFSEFKDILHEDGFIKGMRVGYQFTSERMQKFYYLFHVVLSKEQPVTCLQYACMWSRDDFVILILQYLIGASEEFVEKYINYAANFDIKAIQSSNIRVLPRSTRDHFYNYSNEKQNMTAFDLIGMCSKHSYGIVSSLSQLGSIASNIPKVLDSGRTIYAKILGKGAKSVATFFTDQNLKIRNILQSYGAKMYEAKMYEANERESTLPEVIVNRLSSRKQ